MSACEFTHQTSDPPGLLAAARAAIEHHGGTLDGDTEQGTFLVRTPLGPIHGTYTNNSQSVQLRVERKPRLLACALIEQVVLKFFGRF